MHDAMLCGDGPNECCEDTVCLENFYQCKPDAAATGAAPADDTGAACPSGDAFCRAAAGEGSYCKYWQTGVGGMVCHNSTVPCSCGAGTCTSERSLHAGVRPPTRAQGV